MRRFRRVWLLLSLLAAGLLLLSPAAGQRMKRYRDRPEAHGLKYLKDVEKGVLKLTNKIRRRNGLPVLTNERRLRRIARNHSKDMLVRDYFGHVNPEGETPQDRILRDYPYPLEAVGENIWGAEGSEPLETGLLARIIVDTWMSSPGHRRNILNPDFTDMGVGVAAFGKRIRATQVFGQIKNR
ncbi:MAG: CAP domain-containing protein [Deltaproteobacteria bacterium]|nr:CAP domain-containing protein [Deltaproteobacteria bacterium]